MHDKNGKPVKKGDKVMVEAVIAETYATEEFCNVQLWIGRDSEHSARNVHGTLTINANQVELIEDLDVSKAVQVLIGRLREDKDFYLAYQSNIAMAFFDEAKKANWEYDDLHEICNKAAKRFMDLWLAEQQKSAEIDENIERKGN